MTGNLVDNEDYPRQDIDVYAVRFARNRIICKFFVCLHGDKIYNSFVCGNTT